MKRRFFAPEVIQTSAMDCGPASLKCLLEGFGVGVSYGRLREACQTDVDGTSIDTLEQVVGMVGLEGEQVMLPRDHLLLPEVKVFPAIVVVFTADLSGHFVVAWRRRGPFIEIMDPATGRRFVPWRRFLDEVFLHKVEVPAAAWREWAGTDDFLVALRARMANLGMAATPVEDLVASAIADPSFRRASTLDATVRMVASLVGAGGVRKGDEAAALAAELVERPESIPDLYWSAKELPPGEDGEERIRLKGAVLVRVTGVRARTPDAEPDQPLPPDLDAALKEPPARPGRHLIDVLRADGYRRLLATIMGIAILASLTIFEAVLLRGLLDVGDRLVRPEQRLGAITAVLLFASILFILDWAVMSSVLRTGRRLEMGLRMAFLDKLQRLPDRYLRSRLTSDMAHRGHLVQSLRDFPDLVRSVINDLAGLTITTLGIIWIDPASTALAVGAAVSALAIPIAFQYALRDRDLKVRTHAGALQGSYFDALLGVVPIRTHGAGAAVRREHETLLHEWVRAGRRFLSSTLMLEAIQSLAGVAMTAWLVARYLTGPGEIGGVLLLAYWALQLPVIGQNLALAAREYPLQRNLALRLIEPLGALEDDTGPDVPVERPRTSPARPGGVAVRFENVAVRAAGHTILEGIDLDIAPGEHVAILGPSGAGKSSLVGLLLGWHRPSEGRVLVDGVPLDAAELARLRLDTAWVDPGVQIWNRSLLTNLYYGSLAEGRLPLDRALETADLRDLLKRLPEGLQTSLGEGGALVSGGEGQRVRLGRALLRPGVRLAILDEPFRDLDRPRRRLLLARARTSWQHATILCITHDLAETSAFDRVLVVEEGRVVEAGKPADLIERAGSRYRALLDADEAVRVGLWSGTEWRRMRFDDGRLVREDREPT